MPPSDSTPMAQGPGTAADRCIHDSPYRRRHPPCAAIWDAHVAKQRAQVEPTLCAHGHDTVRLAAVSTAFSANCTWLCLEAALYCIGAQQAHHVSQRSMLMGKVWESECKAQLSSRYRDALDDIAVAGLFGGDWLPEASKRQ